MRVSLAGILSFKPFDESSEIGQAKKIYAENILLSAGVLVSFALLAIGLLAIFFKAPYAFAIWYSGLGVSAITAGLEWSAGLRARPLNQLWIVLMTVVLVSLVDRFGP